MTTAEKALRLRELEREAKKLRREIRRSRPRSAPGAPGKTGAERRQERNENTAAIRALVMERAGGCCEACNYGAPHEAHHVISGGARRSSESVATVVALCLPCHKRAHDNDLLTLSLIADWARRLGYAEAAMAIRKRIAKVEEARRTSSVPVRVVVAEQGGGQ